MNHERVTMIRTCLEQTFTPRYLDIVDESQHHVGHAGTQTGLGHFAITIASDQFIGQSILHCHRLIYQALGALMQTDIHALRINIKRD